MPHPIVRCYNIPALQPQNMSNFVHLHTHSHYSLLDGLPSVPDLVEKVKSSKMKSIALTDHGVMYGAIEFYKACRDKGIKPVIGVEAYVAPNGRRNKRPRIDEKPYHLVLLAKNKTGYQNLVWLTSKAHLEGYYYKPRVDFELLEGRTEGIIALSACLQGEIPRAIVTGNDNQTKKVIEKYAALFGDGNFYLELQDHPTLENQGPVNNKLIEFSRSMGIPLVATNDVHYLNSEDDDAQDVLLCIQTKRLLSDPDRLTQKGEDYSLKTPDHMASVFSHAPEAVSNSVEIAERCNVEIELGKIQLPYFKTPNKATADDYLKTLCYQGINERYHLDLPPEAETPPRLKKVKERLDYELSVIERTGFASYFLIVQDFVNWAKKNSIVVGPGRGSAAGSIVSYLLNITNIDPLQYELLFERFLNPERISMPDIDMDFADTRRDEVIEHVERKYGKDHVAQIITFGTMAARAAVRDVGRVMGLPYTYCDKVAKLIPMFSTLEEALKTISELNDIYKNDPDGKRLIDTAKKLEGVARHSSTHACGVVITKDPLEKHVPLQYASQDDKTIITQYSLHPVDDLGLLKMDFLGLKNLTIIENAIAIIQKTIGQEVDLDQLPLDDKKTFSLLKKGKTTGVFQLESQGMKRYLKQLKPTELEDIIAMVSLYRPGPMELIPEYIDGKHGRRKITYLHPKLEPILNKTYGIAVYQEQVLQIARDLCGFTLGEADVLRKAIGKKIRKLLLEQKEKFIKGGVANGISKEVAKKLFDFTEPFAKYGFNRSHAACYALIAYQTAYLKANFPAQFMAALMTSDFENTDRIAIEVNEAKNMGIKVLPPDINESYSTFTVVARSLAENEPRIRFGLRAIKNVGANIVRVVIDERKKNGPYKNLEDFLTRVQSKDLNKKSLESLIKCGAMDMLGERNTLLANMDALLKFAKTAGRERDNGQTNLFNILPVAASPKLTLKSTEKAGKERKLSWEKELLGLFISEHPLDDYAEALKKISSPINSLAEQKKSSPVKIIGIITEIQRITTRAGQPMMFIKLEDTSGSLEILVFPALLQENAEIWREDKVVAVTGKLSDKDGVIKLLANKVEDIDIKELKNKDSGSPAQAGNNNVQNTVTIRLPHGTRKTVLDSLKKLLDQYPGPYQVCLHLEHPTNSKVVATKASIVYNNEVVSGIENIVGKKCVMVK